MRCPDVLISGIEKYSNMTFGTAIAVSSIEVSIFQGVLFWGFHWGEWDRRKEKEEKERGREEEEKEKETRKSTHLPLLQVPAGEYQPISCFSLQQRNKMSRWSPAAFSSSRPLGHHLSLHGRHEFSRVGGYAVVRNLLRRQKKVSY